MARFQLRDFVEWVPAKVVGSVVGIVLPFRSARSLQLALLTEYDALMGLRVLPRFSWRTRYFVLIDRVERWAVPSHSNGRHWRQLACVAARDLRLRLRATLGESCIDSAEVMNVRAAR